MIRSSLKEHLINVANNTGFEQSIDLLILEARECVFISNSNKPERIGGSRMGGIPDLPKSTQWPLSTNEAGTSGRLANFLAQFDLSELPELNGFPLSRSGHLWIFLKSLWDASGEVHAIGIHSLEGALQPRTPDRHVTWGVEEWMSGSTSLEFEIGVSLPFGDRHFRTALYSRVPKPWELLASALEPDDKQGQIGGFAYTWDGVDLARVVAFTNLGKRGYLEADRLLHSTVFNKESSIPYTPLLYSSYFETLRPQIEWIAQNRDQIQRESSRWHSLAQFRTNLKVNFRLGDSYPLWIFASKLDLIASRFDQLRAESHA